jgi:hypothetical protein
MHPRAATCLVAPKPASLLREGFDNATCPKALDPASSPRRAPTLTRSLSFRPCPTSEVGSSADMCPMALHGPWVIEIKRDLAATACSKAHVFPRHAHTLLRHLQDVFVGRRCHHDLQTVQIGATA